MSQPLFADVIRARRSTRKFVPGREVGRDVIERIVDCGRWAPSGANVQCVDFIAIHAPERREAVRQVFLRQAERLRLHARGFPAVSKNYLANTVAMVIALGDPRWKCCFPMATTPEYAEEYARNAHSIYLASLGAAVQNLQLGAAAEGLTSAWLSGGGEATTNAELSALLGFPDWMTAYGMVAIGYPVAEQDSRYRRPLAQALHWDRYEPTKYRPHAMVDFYESTLRPFAMYRDREALADWPDAEEKLGDWRAAFESDAPNPSGMLEPEADFSAPRTAGPATKARGKPAKE